jgi:hypothetical protein
MRLKPALHLVPALLAAAATPALAHNLSGTDAEFVSSQAGPAIAPYLYLGAKHMITGVDHLLYLLGVIFFLYRGRDVVLYVTLFTIGHSTTLLLGVLAGWQLNSHLIDAIIGLSIAYKAFENLNGFNALFGASPDPRLAVLVFGLCHGLGLATRLQGMMPDGEGLLTNLLSFNIGVELGQLLALAVMLALLVSWRTSPSFSRQAFTVNCVLMSAGFVLAGHQFAGYLFA